MSPSDGKPLLSEGAPRARPEEGSFVGWRFCLAEDGVAAKASELIIESTSVDIVGSGRVYLLYCGEELLGDTHAKDVKQSRFDAWAWRDFVFWVEVHAWQAFIFRAHFFSWLKATTSSNVG
jgi:hypothetical protein